MLVDDAGNDVLLIERVKEIKLLFNYSQKKIVAEVGIAGFVHLCNI